MAPTTKRATAAIGTTTATAILPPLSSPPLLPEFEPLVIILPSAAVDVVPAPPVAVVPSTALVEVITITVVLPFAEEVNSVVTTVLERLLVLVVVGLVVVGAVVVGAVVDVEVGVVSVVLVGVVEVVSDVGDVVVGVSEVVVGVSDVVV
jgi:hypothetical protein